MISDYCWSLKKRDHFLAAFEYYFYFNVIFLCFSTYLHICHISKTKTIYENGAYFTTHDAKSPEKSYLTFREKVVTLCYS